MSSIHVQEFQFSKFSESRKKIDVQYTENAAEKREDSLEYESENDNRDSLAWDSAFFTSPGILEPEELLERLNVGVVEHGVDAPGKVLSKSLEEGKTKGICEFNMRRSLAWDSAFFTSAGVLDPEELSIVNKGFKKSGAYALPEIFDERIWRSADIDSDGYSLESLEIGLFDYLKVSKTSNSTASSSKFGKGNGLQLQNTHSSKKLDASSRVKMKSMPALKGQSLNRNASERVTKTASLAPQAQHMSQGGSCTPLSSRKQTKVSGSRRASSGSKQITMENKSTKGASGQHQHMAVSKRPCLGKSCSSIHESISIPKSPPLSSYATTSKSTGLVSAPSDSTGGSPLTSPRRKIDSGLATSSSPSTLRYVPKNKAELLNSSLPFHFLSSLKSFSASPTATSSFDICSSGSSASSNFTESMDASKQISSDGDKNCFTLGDRHTRFLNQQFNKISTENISVLTNISSNIRSSGLRKPSPKIGFFDAENSMAILPIGGPKFQHDVHTSSKTGKAIAHHSGAATRTMHRKLQSGGTCSQQNGDPYHPLRIRQSHAAPFGEHKGNQGLTKTQKGVIREGHDSRRAKKNSLKEAEDADKLCPPNITYDDDKENFCCHHNQVDGLSKYIEAIDFIQDV